MSTLEANLVSEDLEGSTSSFARFAPRHRTVNAKPLHIHTRVSRSKEAPAPERIAAPWFVYLCVLKDGSTFELGFSGDPLDHLRSLAPRFHERFDLHASMLLRVDSCARARQITAKLEQQLRDARVISPDDLTYIARDSQWFDAAQFGHAQHLLTSAMGDGSTSLVTLASVVGHDLARLQSGTEAWAFSTARRLNADIAYVPSASHLELARSLRDCLDAYRALRVPLFACQPEQGNFVWQIVRVYRPALAAIL